MDVGFTFLKKWYKQINSTGFKKIMESGSSNHLTKEINSKNK